MDNSEVRVEIDEARRILRRAGHLLAWVDNQLLAKSILDLEEMLLEATNRAPGLSLEETLDLEEIEQARDALRKDVERAIFQIAQATNPGDPSGQPPPWPSSAPSGSSGGPDDDPNDSGSGVPRRPKPSGMSGRERERRPNVGPGEDRP